MGLDTLLKMIETETRNEIERIEEESRQQSREIERSALHTAEQNREKIEQEGRRRAEEEQRLLLLQAEFESAQRLREARWEGISRAFSEAEEIFATLTDSPDYPDIIRRLVLEGMEVVGNGAVLVYCRTKDEEAVRLAVSGLDQAEVRPLPTDDLSIISGGVIITSGDGRIRCDQTFDTRLDQMRNLLIRRIQSLLFGGDGSGY